MTAKLTWLVKRRKNPFGPRPTAHFQRARADRGRSMSSKPRFGLEAFKFATYVSVPIFMTVAFAANPENLETIIKQHAYVVYPPEGPKPPTAREMRMIVEANKKKRLDLQKEPSRGWFARSK